MSTRNAWYLHVIYLLDEVLCSYVIEKHWSTLFQSYEQFTGTASGARIDHLTAYRHDDDSSLALKRDSYAVFLVHAVQIQDKKSGAIWLWREISWTRSATNWRKLDASWPFRTFPVSIARDVERWKFVLFPRIVYPSYRHATSIDGTGSLSYCHGTRKTGEP